MDRLFTHSIEVPAGYRHAWFVCCSALLTEFCPTLFYISTSSKNYDDGTVVAKNFDQETSDKTTQDFSKCTKYGRKHLTQYSLFTSSP